MQLPEEFKKRLIDVAAQFKFDHPEVDYDDITELMMDVTTIVTDFMCPATEED